MNRQIDCKKIYEKIKGQVLTAPTQPEFTCFLVSDENGNFDKASEKYVELKQKTAEEFGIKINVLKMNVDKFVNYMKNDIIGIRALVMAMLQLPAPKKAIECFNLAEKLGYIIDVDHLADNTYLDILKGNLDKCPATPRAVLDVIKEVHGDDLKGKRVAVIGSRSNTCGKYLAPMLGELGMIVTQYNSRTPIDESMFLEEEIIVSCVGEPRGFFKNCKLKDKLFIDVGVTIVDGRAVGDFDESIRENNLYTPYVNGIGLLTRANLMLNTFLLSRNK